MIQFLVTGQMLQVVTPVLVSDTHNYISAEATFNGNDWDNTTKWAHFTLDDKTYHVPFYNNRIYNTQHVDLTAGTWQVYLTGNELVDEVSVTRITTNSAIIYVEAAQSDSPFPSLTPEFEEVLAAQINQALEIAQSVRDDADDGDFDGATFTPSVNENGVISWTNNKGKTNPQSVEIKGPKGDPGTSFTIKGFYDTYEEMAAAITEPAANDCYGVGTNTPYIFYIWDPTNEEWVNLGGILVPVPDIGPAYGYVNAGYGTPSVDVVVGGNLTRKTFTFTFSNIQGYSPVKGTDYYTAADKAEIVADVAASINADDLNVIGDPTNKSSGQFLKWNGTAWVADTPAYPVTKVNNLTGDVTTRLIFNDVELATSAFSEQASPIYESFPYVATLALTGVAPDMVPEVIFDPESAALGIFASAAASGNGTVTIFAADVPDDDITIPTIICWR